MNQRPTSILVVDDELDACRNLADILGDLGFQVDTVQSGADALALVREKPYDVALLDLKMPGMDGLTLYRELRKLRAGTVAIIVTAYANSETTTEALNAGAWQVLSKPVDFGRLLPLIKYAADQPLVLIVDDDHALCENLWESLREFGYRVCLAHDGRETSDRLQGRDFQVVLIDMKLPGGDGYEVFRLVRRAAPQARTVLVTGYRSELCEMIEQTVKEGADAVCYKPFDVSALLETIGRLSQRPKF